MSLQTVVGLHLNNRLQIGETPIDYRDEKRRLIELVVQHGVEEKEFKLFAAKMGVNAPEEMISRWQKRFFTARPILLSAEPRLINRYCIGADPEFALLQPTVVKERGFHVEGYIHARTLGMNVAEPFGSDLSGRQAEVRAHPSRFVVDVVASLVDTFRWMNDMYSVGAYHWYAGAMIGNDGIGGHIHIGRKRPGKSAAIKSLDKLTLFMTKEKIGIDGKGAENRSAITNYGKYGDIRTQAHGYEYRTMPTWLDTPLTAYLTLVWAKLAVLHGLNGLAVDIKSNRGYTALRNLLLAYENRDDDARIALRALDTFGVPRFTGNDFKKNWGVSEVSWKLDINTHFFPNTIAPSPDTIHSVFEYLSKGIPIPKKHAEASWRPFELPKHVTKLNIEARVPGVGEVGQGLVSHNCTTIITFGLTKSSVAINIPKVLSLSKDEIRKFVRKLPTINTVTFHVGDSGSDLIIYLPKNINVDYHADNKIVADIRALLQSGLFPITKGEEIASYDATKFVPIKKNNPLVGRIDSVISGQAER